jgi:phosphate transport system substrate-binding protein
MVLLLAGRKGGYQQVGGRLTLARLTTDETPQSANPRRTTVPFSLLPREEEFFDRFVEVTHRSHTASWCLAAKREDREHSLYPKVRGATVKRSIVLAAVVGLSLSCGGRAGEGGTSRVMIQNKGSDTMVNVAQAWSEAYGQKRPGVTVAVSGGGSGTGFSALINGTVDIANASREIRESEIEAVRAARGIVPVQYIVGYDALAIFLHPNNPISSITIPVLAAIYGDSSEVDSWSDLGVTVPGCPSGEIVRVSRQNNSGTYAYFQEAVLGEREFGLGSRDMHGSKDVVDLVEHTPCAIGYSGLAYAAATVKMPCVSARDGAPCIAPTEQTALDRSYPISRPLFMYTAGAPTGAVKEYLDWILSDEGQCIIMQAGYAPIRASLTCPVTSTR